MRTSTAVVFSLTFVLGIWILMMDPVPEELEDESAPSIPVGRLVVPGQPDLDVAAVLAAGKEPSVFASEYDTDLRAQRYALARRVANDASLGNPQDLSVLNQLRSALYAWDFAVYEAASFQARGGTMYVHLSARSAAETEDFLATIVSALSSLHEISPDAVVGNETTRMMLRRIAAIELLDFGVEDEVATTEARRKELADHRAKLAAAWNRIELCLQGVDLPQAARVRARCVRLFEHIPGA